MYKLVFTGLVIFIGISCSNKHELPPELVAQVNDSYLVKDNINSRVPVNLQEDTKLSMKKVLIKQWVEEEIIYQTAVKEGFRLNENEQFQVENYEKSLIIQHYLDAKLNINYKVPDKDIEDYYNDNRKEFIRKEDEVHVIHLLIENKDKAIFDEISDTKNLQEIIDKHYYDIRSTYERPNGDLGYVPTESLPQIIQRAVRNQKTGSISKPLKSNDGYHFIQLKDKQKKGSQIDLELIKDEIVRRLKWQMRGQEQTRLMDELRSKFQVQTYLSKVQ